jgi:hypothetical protein
MFEFCLGTICHEIWTRNTFFGNYLVQLLPHNTLNFYVFWLHVTHYNRHHFIVNQIIHVASQGHPSNMLDMIKHEPTCFKIALRLHPFHQITTTTISLYRHLEKEHFFYRHLSRKTIILNVIITLLNFKARMLSMYPLWSKWCLNNATKFLMLGKHNVMNLSIIWYNLSPFKNSTRPSPSSLNKCSTRRFCLLPLLLLTSRLMGCKKPPHWTKL